MRHMASAALALALSTAGCFFMSSAEVGPRPPHPTLIPDQHIALDFFVAFEIGYSSGVPGDPEYLSAFSVRCSDPEMCVTKMERHPHLSNTAVALVAGLKQGDAELIIGYTDPTTQQLAEQRVKVHFVAPVKPISLDVGVKTPSNDFDLLLLKDKQGQEYACTGATTVELRSGGVDVPAPTLEAQPADPKAPFDEERRSIYRCEPSRELAPGRRYFSGTVGSTIDPERGGLYVCASREGGLYGATIDGLALYRQREPGPKHPFHTDELRGHPNPKVCFTEAAPAP
jgi:hypothetical protein